MTDSLLFLFTLCLVLFSVLLVLAAALLWRVYRRGPEWIELARQAVFELQVLIAGLSEVSRSIDEAAEPTLTRSKN